MEGDRLSQHEYIQRVQAAFYDLLKYLETYDAPCETEEQQLAFFESFLRERALRQTKRHKNLWQNGAYHTRETFRDSLRDAISRHGQRNPKTLQDSMAYFFDAKFKTFNESYTRKCKASREQLGGLLTSSVQQSGQDQSLECDNEDLMTESTMSPAPEKTKRSVSSSEGSLAPPLKELLGYRGTETQQIGQPSGGHVKRKGLKRSPLDKHNSKVQIVHSSSPRQLVPVITRQRGLKRPLSRWSRDDLSKIKVETDLGLESTKDYPLNIGQAVKPDRRLIQSRMTRAEAICDSFRDQLGDMLEGQASFIADPSSVLQRLYTTAFGSSWRIVFAGLQQERLANSADILYTLTGAALYDFVFGQTICDPRPSSSATLIAEDTCAGLRQDHLSDEEASMIFARRLSKALDEHMRYQPTTASRPIAFVQQSLERELSLIFAEALALKQDMLATGAAVVYGWHLPGTQYMPDTMGTGMSHAAPPIGTENMCRVGLCFLPTIHADGDHNILYRAQVKVAR